MAQLRISSDAQSGVPPGRDRVHSGTQGSEKANQRPDGSQPEPRSSRPEDLTRTESGLHSAPTDGKADRVAAQSAPPAASVSAAWNSETAGLSLGTASPVAHISGARSSTPEITTDAGSTHATFERMDAAAPPQVLASSPQRLEVGVRDSGLGWVEIRTHTAAGQVSAVVSTATTEAHAALSAQLPAMREYLAAQHVRVDTLGSDQFSPSAGERDSSHGSQTRSYGTHREAPPPANLDPAAAATAEEETLSYISIRV